MVKAKLATLLIGEIYARYSSRFQHSIDDQIRTCREWAKANGVHVPDEFIFTDVAVTGRSSRRDGLRRLQATIESGRVVVVIIFSTNRLFRKLYKSLAFVEEEIVDRGLRCVFVCSGIDSAREDQWRQMLHVQGLIDEFILEMTAQHVRASHVGLLLQMRVFGTISFGYIGEPIEGVTTKRGRPAKRLAVDPEQAKWVRQVFEWFIFDRLSIAEIVRRMNDRNAPLPPRSQSRRWTGTGVTRLLRNERYIGNWAYGATKVVWQNKQNYARYVEREEPLREVKYEALRIIDDATWQRAQALLADLSRNAGRRPKEGNPRRQPRVLNGFLYCRGHQKRLKVFGQYARYMVCGACQESTEPHLHTQLRRDLVTAQVCTRLAELITDTPDLVVRIVERARTWAERLGQPDEQELEARQRQIERLTQQIQFILGSPGETDMDRDENHARLADLRQQRATLLADKARMEEVLARPQEIPDEAVIRAAVGDMAQVLLRAAESEDPAEVAAVREIVELMTGGRIELVQMGERRRGKGWLQARFRVSLVRPLQRRLGLRDSADKSADVVIDIRQPHSRDQLSEEVMARVAQGMLYKEIAADLGLWRSQVTLLVQHWHRVRGLPLPDGRARRSTLDHKQSMTVVYQEIGERAHTMAVGDLSDREIGRQLDVRDQTVRKAIAWHCQTHGLPCLTAEQRRNAKLSRACRLLSEGRLLKDVAADLQYTPRGLKLALERYLSDRGQCLLDGRTRRGNARSGESAQHPELFVAGLGAEEVA